MKPSRRGSTPEVRERQNRVLPANEMFAKRNFEVETVGARILKMPSRHRLCIEASIIVHDDIQVDQFLVVWRRRQKP